MMVKSILDNMGAGPSIPVTWLDPYYKLKRKQANDFKVLQSDHIQLLNCCISNSCRRNAIPFNC